MSRDKMQSAGRIANKAVQYTPYAGAYNTGKAVYKGVGKIFGHHKQPIIPVDSGTADTSKWGNNPDVGLYGSGGDPNSYENSGLSAQINSMNIEPVGYGGTTDVPGVSDGTVGNGLDAAIGNELIPSKPANASSSGGSDSGKPTTASVFSPSGGSGEDKSPAWPSFTNMGGAGNAAQYLQPSNSTYAPGYSDAESQYERGFSKNGGKTFSGLQPATAEGGWGSWGGQQDFHNWLQGIGGGGGGGGGGASMMSPDYNIFPDTSRPMPKMVG